MDEARMDHSGARVSVIVPVRDRRDLLGALLRALEGQTFRDFEVVIVDDGSQDGSGDYAEAHIVADRRVRVVRGPEQGAVAARQVGVEAAAGNVLAFTDSDCAPDPGWLAAAVGAIDDGAAVVNGRTQPARPLRPLERSMGSSDEGLYPTCNVFYQRAVFEAAGGFDGSAASRLGFRVNERARGLGFGEDTLLAWRVRRDGVETRYVPDAVVYHHVFPADFTEWLSRCWMVAAFPALVAEVPELRSSLVRRGVLFGGRTRVPMYATAGALLLRNRAAVGLAAAWWAWTRLRELRTTGAPLGEQLVALPKEMVLDVVTGAALITGSVRARTPLL
jgi:glycosyltransferase involved in cell wall biosynthesis